jgi:hypothetical protein
MKYEYRGDINGFFWRNQSINDIYELCEIKKRYNYYWKVCDCMIEDKTETYCTTCYKSYEEHLQDVKEEEEEEEDCEDVEREEDEEEYIIVPEFKKDKNKLYYKSNYSIYLFNQDHLKQIKKKLKLIKKQIDRSSFVITFNDDVYNIELKENYDDKYDELVAKYCLGYHLAHHLEENEDCEIEIY